MRIVCESALAIEEVSCVAYVANGSSVLKVNPYLSNATLAQEIASLMPGIAADWALARLREALPEDDPARRVCLEFGRLDRESPVYEGASLQVSASASEAVSDGGGV